MEEDDEFKFLHRLTAIAWWIKSCWKLILLYESYLDSMLEKEWFIRAVIENIRKLGLMAVSPLDFRAWSYSKEEIIIIGAYSKWNILIFQWINIGMFLSYIFLKHLHCIFIVVTPIKRSYWVLIDDNKHKYYIHFCLVIVSSIGRFAQLCCHSRAIKDTSR